MIGNLERFTVDAGSNRLMVRHYAPSTDAFAGGAVVLVHGLSSSADIWDVPGLEAVSLARALQAAGLRVITFDQRGAGQSTTATWRFTLGDLAHGDLPAVIGAVGTRLGIDRIVLGGHSLGGLIWLRWLQRRPDVTLAPRVVGGFAIASPAVFDPADPPWSALVRRGRGFIAAIDRDGDAIVSREEFVASQIELDWPWARPVFRPSGIRIALGLGGRSSLAAGLLRISPFPTLIYRPGDFDNGTFRRVLASTALDKTSAALLLDLYEQIPKDSPPAASAPLPLDVLCIGSTDDRFIPLKTVMGFAAAFRSADVRATETVFGAPSGHVGYFFKATLRPKVFGAVTTYARSALS